MKHLTAGDIQELAERPRVNTAAVVNFLYTVSADISYQAHVANCELDARLYSWNRETTAAIREGLARMFR